MTWTWQEPAVFAIVALAVAYVARRFIGPRRPPRPRLIPATALLRKRR